jgi:aryl-alcohol dehydrogenase-like predicted oxidoreductase
MQYRVFPRTNWKVAEIGYGTWGMAGWSGSEDAESLRAMEHALSLGCNFFDTAWAYGAGRSERLLRQLLKDWRGDHVYVATKVPPKNGKWPARADYRLDDVFPPDHIREMTEKSLENLGLDCVDVQQLHVWTDAWAEDERWQRAVDDLKREGLIKAFGISINRWEPANVVKALRTGLVDCVQVVYNIFDQNPEDELFPVCRDLDIGIIARVPFDEGSLTGTLKADATFPDGDWRNLYFTGENLAGTIDRVERLRPAVPSGMTMPELALRFILEHPLVTTTIPGMRRPKHVESNLATADGKRLDPGLMTELRRHRWERTTVIP